MLSSVLSLILTASLFVGGPIPDAEAATEIDPFSTSYDEAIWGDYILAANSVLRCLESTDPDIRDVDGDGNTTESLASVLGVGSTHMNGCASESNSSSSGVAPNDFRWLYYQDVDADPTTFNSSSATIEIPAGALVEHAALYWGGNLTDAIGGVNGVTFGK